MKYFVKLVQLNLKLFMNKKILRVFVSTRPRFYYKQPRYLVNRTNHSLDKLVILNEIRNDVIIKYE